MTLRPAVDKALLTNNGTDVEFIIHALVNAAKGNGAFASRPLHPRSMFVFDTAIVKNFASPRAAGLVVVDELNKVLYDGFVAVRAAPSR